MLELVYKNISVKEKLEFFVQHGMAIKYIAERMGVDPSTLSKWLSGAKGITHKNEDKLNSTLQQIAKELSVLMEV